MKDRFYYRRGFIVERLDGRKEELIADFLGGALRSRPSNKKDRRIIKLLNFGYVKQAK